MRGIVGERRIERQLRNVPAHDVRVGEIALRRHVHGLGLRAATLRDHVTIDTALVAVVGERRHVELAADALQVEIRDGRVGAVGDVIPIHRKSGGAALRDLRACNRGRLEDQIASHVRSGAGSAGDVIGLVDAGIRGRNVQVARQAAKIDVSRLHAQIECDRTFCGVGQRHLTCRGRARAVRRGARVQTDAASVYPRLRVDGARGVAGGHQTRRVQLDVAVKRIEVRERLATQIEVRVGGDVALLLRILDDRREIEILDGEVAGYRLPRCLQIRSDLAPHVARGRLDVHIDAEPIQRSRRFDLKPRLQLDAGERRDDARDFRQRQLVRADLEVEHRLVEIVLDRALERQRGFSRLQLELFDKNGIVTHRDAP